MHFQFQKLGGQTESTSKPPSFLKRKITLSKKIKKNAAYDKFPPRFTQAIARHTYCHVAVFPTICTALNENPLGEGSDLPVVDTLLHRLVTSQFVHYKLSFAWANLLLYLFMPLSSFPISSSFPLAENFLKIEDLNF